MSLKFGSASKKAFQLQIVKQVPKRVRVEEISPENNLLNVLTEPFIKPTDYVTMQKLLQQYRQLAAALPTVR